MVAKYYHPSKENKCSAKRHVKTGSTRMLTRIFKYKLKWCKNCKVYNKKATKDKLLKCGVIDLDKI
jgi:hypothetical protein